MWYGRQLKLYFAFLTVLILLQWYEVMKLVRQVGWGRALLVLFLIWLLVLVLFAASPVFWVPSSPEADSRTTQRLARAFHDLEVLKKQNAELRSLFADISMG
jgi:hypothetical protein